MSSSPQWMPLHVADYLRDTGHLSVAEHGAYLLLIMRYWQDGGLPSDEVLVRRYSLLSAEQWIESRPVLAALFDEGWKHKRIDEELAKAADLISKRSARAVQQHSRRRAGAAYEQGTSADTRVPPLQEHLPDNHPPSVPEPEGARDLFSELVEAFPANPSSSEAKARKAFDRIKADERASVIEAAVRYARWFTQDCETRGRTVDAGLSFVPHLSTWLDGGQWREASKLPLKGEGSAPIIPMTRLDRERDHELWDACEKLMGKPAPTSGMEWSFRTEIVEQARATL